VHYKNFDRPHSALSGGFPQSPAIRVLYKKATTVCEKLNTRTRILQDPQRDATPLQNCPPKNPYKAKTIEIQKEIGTYDALQKQTVYFELAWSTDKEWITTNPIIKPKDAIRVWFQNLNSISAKDGMRIFRGDLDEAIDREIDFLALPESKLNSNNNYVFESISSIVYMWV